MSVTNLKVAPFLNKLRQINDDYRGVFQGNDDDLDAIHNCGKLLSTGFELNVRSDLSELYECALRAINSDLRGDDITKVFNGLVKMDDLLLVAELTRDDVSPIHEGIFESLEYAMEQTDGYEAPPAEPL